jgi:hypothetical protein
MMARKPLKLINAMCHAGDMAYKDGWPKCYYWNSVWYRLHAKRSANPQEQLQYSRNLIGLYTDIVSRPRYYRLHKRISTKTDWQIFQGEK